ncbi:hypothetical protein IWZ03DRAFT_374980 [Phyllosticta citriasiana]|uniref:Uncharacterized protein n=1 Tax=Phyllosticta citriasiana TaxID=595635 RepID=A0ABR1KPT1_9PEZI
MFTVAIWQFNVSLCLSVSSKRLGEPEELPDPQPCFGAPDVMSAAGWGSQGDGVTRPCLLSHPNNREQCQLESRDNWHEYEWRQRVAASGREAGGGTQIRLRILRGVWQGHG